MADRAQTVWISLLLTVIALLAALGTSGCVGEGERRVGGTNTSYEITQLFKDSDGCSVRRFQDGLNFHYYVVCPGGAASTQSTVSCGKNCTREVEIQTVPR